LLPADTPHKPLPKNAGLEAIHNLDKLRFANGKYRTADVRDKMQR
jgi:hypothetical protein